MDLLRSQLIALGLPLLSLEIEFGPSQFELVFGPTAGLEPADTMVLLRSAIKQICQRNGYHATFMCRPRIPNVMSSGWHLHLGLLEDQLLGQKPRPFWSAHEPLMAEYAQRQRDAAL